MLRIYIMAGNYGDPDMAVLVEYMTYCSIHETNVCAVQ